MPNGTKGDHPLSDILSHGLNVYGPEADALIRQIAKLCSRRELDEWWGSEIGWTPDPNSVLPKCRARHAELLKRAKESGWELTHDT